MTTVSHKNLTGTQLHEPKGAAAAAADKVYVSDGAASGTWQKITASQLTTTGNPFGGQLLHVQDQKTQNTDGGTFTTGAVRTRTLNTVVTNEITSASLASNQITLPSGTYRIDAHVPAYTVGSHQATLYNITTAAVLLRGLTAYAYDEMTDSLVRGTFTLSGTTVLEIRHQCESTVSTTGFGNSANFGTEIYTDVQIWKIL